MIIYHNPRCGKSREGICILDQSDLKYTTKHYIKDGITLEELQHITKALNVKPIDIVRTKETIWKEQYQDKNLDDLQILEVIVQHPILLERPIVLRNDRGVIGRPPENITNFIDNI